MKNVLNLGCLILGTLFSYSQVGIGQNVTSLDDSEALKIVSSNKGVLIPNISITNLNLASPVTAPANSLLVYNTNPTIGNGFYVWENNKWNPLINSTNIYKYLGIIKTLSRVSNATITDTTTNGAVSYTIGEGASAHDWQLIPNLSQDFDIYSPVNNISVNVGGTVQATSSNGGNTSHSYAMAIFIDDQLASVRNYFISGSGNCLYNDFNLFMTKNNLSIGNHNVKVYETYRVNIGNNTDPVLSFGGKNSTCTNISTDMSRTILNIQISEKP